MFSAAPELGCCWLTAEDGASLLRGLIIAAFELPIAGSNKSIMLSDFWFYLFEILDSQSSLF
jgi:hypothetical protein